VLVCELDVINDGFRLPMDIGRAILVSGLIDEAEATASPTAASAPSATSSSASSAAAALLAMLSN